MRWLTLVLVSAMLAVGLTAGAAAHTSEGSLAQSEKLLARNSTNRSYAGVSEFVYLRDDPDYARDLRALRTDLIEAQRELREAEDSIVNFGDNPKESPSVRAYLAPYRERVADVKAALADLAADYSRPYRTYGFRVRTSGPQTVELTWTVSCSRSGGDIDRQGTVTKRTPITLWRSPTVSRAYSCYLSASTYRDSGSSGRMVTTLVGKR